MPHQNERFVVLGEHFYQPPRRATHSRLKQLQTDPQGINWTAQIADECYIPQLERGTLQHTSFDFYTTLRHEMRTLSPENTPKLKEAMRKRGVGDPFLHVLLPDLNRKDKDILIGAGKHAFTKETGKAPQWFWAPETALDNDTLVALIRAGYKGVICAPEQIISSEAEADNQPFTITLPGQGSIIALPFDRPLSSSLAFDGKHLADVYAQNVIIPRLLRLPQTQPLVAWTDGETFGHHAKKADEFLHYLATTALPELGIAMLGINETTQVWEKNDYKTGKLQQKSAWSCPHGNLIRWHGACPCDEGFHGGWKEPFTAGLQAFNTSVDQLLDSQLDANWRQQLITQFDQAFRFTGGKNTTLSLLAAKASALAALTSCATFFNNPMTSGRINMLFAHQAVEHMRDAQKGREAMAMMSALQAQLARGKDPHSGQTLDKLFANMLVR